MTARRVSTFLTLALALSACGQSEEPAAPAVNSAPAAATEGTTTQQAGSPMVNLQAPANPAVPTPTPGAPGASTATGPGGPGHPPMDLGGIGRALGAAVEASQNAGGDTDCEKAYNGILAMMEAMQKATGRPAPRRMDQSAFMRGCAELPPQIQKCMVIGYGMQHQQECQAARAQLTPELQERVQGIMRGARPSNGPPPSAPAAPSAP
jgi:hypothetical protein